MNFQFLVSVQNTLSSLSLCTLILSKHKRNLSALSVSQSLRGLEKDELHPPSLETKKSRTSSTYAFLELVKANKNG